MEELFKVLFGGRAWSEDDAEAKHYDAREDEPHYIALGERANVRVIEAGHSKINTSIVQEISDNGDFRTMNRWYRAVRPITVRMADDDWRRMMMFENEPGEVFNAIVMYDPYNHDAEGKTFGVVPQHQCYVNEGVSFMSSGYWFILLDPEDDDE